ncbi:DUF4828 domain-containing protein [Liquorilactobacillus hordei]|uniref:DUF4828 domain-containing protein n=1 Tax=Liquorilactobacillus hordei TaxID=468911 RepID=A0A3S6QLS0_9LACO|nr:DUF4828 domain-containing protein [Liquorilactobacillus hordei]AUJ28862.1 hypothetical protein BSQ49_00720 [Liquorilactobacillus hordei]
MMLKKIIIKWLQKLSTPFLNNMAPRSTPKSPSSLIADCIGKWCFKDQNQVTRDLNISKDLAVTLDDYPLDVKIKQLDKTKLSLIDHYGFRLIIYFKNNIPYKFYDETENQVFDLLPN